MLPDSRAAQQQVERYIRDGWAPIPVPAGTKNPNRDNWQTERPTIEDVPRLWNNGQNVGVRLGEPSGGLVDVDYDTREARIAARYIMPPTRTSGRASSPASHGWYVADPIPTTKRYQTTGPDRKRATLVELRSTGAQTIIPPSVHPSRERIEWTDEAVEVARVAGDELAQAVGDVATAALLAHSWPVEGARHDLALAAAGYLGRRIPRERVERIMRGAIAASGDDERDDRERAVSDTLDRLARGENVTGGPTLDELAPGLIEQLARWHKWNASEFRAATLTAAPSTNGTGAETGAHRSGQRRELTEAANGERFVDQHRGRVCWCPPLKKWLVYDGRRWASDDRGRVVKLATATARSIYGEAVDEPDTGKQQELARWAKRSQSKASIEAMLFFAKPDLSVGMDELDRDPWLLNCQNGTLDLRTGELRPHDPADHVTKIVPVAYDPAATCPRFDAFLAETLVHDDVIRFVQRFAGYSITGSTRERALVMLWGRGKNGKSTLVELIQEMLGDYGTNTDVETILMQHYRGVGNDVAALKGARFVSTAEVEKGRQLAESKLKALTGSDTVTARFLYGEPFSFRPELKLWISTNNKPVIEGTDDAIWDRVRLVPFTQRFEGSKADPELPAKLRAELAGVLAWAVRGCLDWQQHGLEEPEAVVAAVQEYREESDVLAAFFEDCCVIRPEATAQATPLYQEYRRWSFANGEDPAIQRVFGSWLRERGFTSQKITRGALKGYKAWAGIGLLVDHDGPDDGGGGSPRPGSGPSFGPPRGQLVDDGPPPQSGLDIGNAQGRPGAVDDGGPKSNNFLSDVPRVEKFSENRSTKVHSSTKVHREPVERKSRTPARSDGSNERRPAGTMPRREPAQES